MARYWPAMPAYNVWVEPLVYRALGEAYAGMGRSWTVRFILISLLEHDPVVKHKVKTFDEYLATLKHPLKYVGQGSRRMIPLSVRLHTPLFMLVDRLVGHLGESRSEVMRAVINQWVEESISWGNPALAKTLKELGLPRRTWPWEVETK